MIIISPKMCGLVMLSMGNDENRGYLADTEVFVRSWWAIHSSFNQSARGFWNFNKFAIIWYNMALIGPKSSDHFFLKVWAQITKKLTELGELRNLRSRVLPTSVYKPMGAKRFTQPYSAKQTFAGTHTRCSLHAQFAPKVFIMTKPNLSKIATRVGDWTGV